MENEELAILIQNGRSDLLPDLWQNVERLIFWKAHRVAYSIHPENASSAEDLKQDLTQSGYIAMVEAVKTYSQEKGAFSTWLMFHLQTEFSKATGWKTTRQQNDPIHTAGSLNITVEGKDRNTTELGNLIEDPSATAELEAVENRIFLQELRAALIEALRKIPAEYRQPISLRYLSGLTAVDVAALLNLDYEEVRRRISKGLHEIRRSGGASRLRSFVDFDHIGGTGLGAYRSSGMSIQERYVISQDYKAAAVAARSIAGPEPGPQQPRTGSPAADPAATGPDCSR